MTKIMDKLGYDQSVMDMDGYGYKCMDMELDMDIKEYIHCDL